jgi:hypothetical protein
MGWAGTLGDMSVCDFAARMERSREFFDNRWTVCEGKNHALVWSYVYVRASEERRVLMRAAAKSRALDRYVFVDAHVGKLKCECCEGFSGVFYLTSIGRLCERCRG